MRQIGTLPRSLDPKVFGDYLVSLGMKARFVEQPECYAVWIYDENHLERARTELQSFLNQPDDPRFRSAGQTAETIRRKKDDLDRQYRKNFREVSASWGQTSLRSRPLTVALVVASVAVFFMQESPEFPEVEPVLAISYFHRNAEGELRDNGLEEILRGQVWRLVTPIFLHFGLMHILFNSWALTVEGTLIETRRGTARLAALVLVAAVVSNLGQYFYMEKVAPGTPHLFGGMSGVVYALFGYLWMKGQYEPEQGMILHPNSITMMLLWLLLCMTGVMGPIANAAHLVGLVVGVAFGVLRF